MFPRKKGRLKMNKKEFMIKMEVYHSYECAATLGSYFFWGPTRSKL